MQRDIADLMEDWEARGLQLSREGEQIRYRYSKGASVPDDLLIEVRTNKDRVLQHLEALSAKNVGFTNDVNLIPILNQRRIWRFTKPGASVDPASTNKYHAIFRVPSSITLDTLLRGIQDVVTKNDALRYRVEDINDGPAFNRQYECNSGPSIYDLTDVESEARLLDFVAGLVWAPFNFPVEPVFRCFVVKLKDDKSILGIVIHQLVVDDYGLTAFMRQMMAAVSGQGDNSEVKHNISQYTNYLMSWQEWIVSDQSKAARLYWRNCLRGAPRHTSMWAPDVLSSESGVRQVRFCIAAEGTKALRELGRRLGVTPFTLLIVANALALYKLTTARDMVFLIPYLLREDPSTHSMIGSLRNHSYLRLQVARYASLLELVEYVQQQVMEALTQIRLPFEYVVERISNEYLEVPLVSYYPYDHHNIGQEESMNNLGLEAILVAESRSDKAIPRELTYQLSIVEGESEFNGALIYDASRCPVKVADNFIREYVDILTKMESSLHKSIDLETSVLR